MIRKHYRLSKTRFILLALSIIATPSDVFCFGVFDGTLYKKKPDLIAYGLKPINIIYGGSFWDAGKNKENLPSDSRIQKLAIESSAKNIETVLDVEHWEVSTGRANGKEAENLHKYIAFFGKFKEYARYLNTGFYGVPPIQDYWRAITLPESRQYLEWQKENDFLRPLAEKVDILYPSLYTFYLDQEGWKKYAKANILEARRISKAKPVYVFLWPQYHDSNKNLRGKYIDQYYWKMQLDLSRKHADGIVIWGGWQEYWNNDAPWWKVTKEFLENNNK